MRVGPATKQAELGVVEGELLLFVLQEDGLDGAVDEVNDIPQEQDGMVVIAITWREARRNFRLSPPTQERAPASSPGLSAST